MVVRVGASLIILGICRTANVTATQLFGIYRYRDVQFRDRGGNLVFVEVE